jgi:hypothetical protein
MLTTFEDEVGSYKDACWEGLLLELQEKSFDYEPAGKQMPSSVMFEMEGPSRHQLQVPCP